MHVIQGRSRARWQPYPSMAIENEQLASDVLGSAFFASPYASMILDWGGRILVANRRAQRSFHPSASATDRELAGLHLSELTRCDADTVLSRLRKGAASGNTGFPMIGNSATILAPETEFRVSLLRAAAKGERLMLLTQDQLRANAESLRQMNELRSKLRGELRQAREDILSLQETLLTMQAFARAASHDLRTPIGTLIGSLQFFSDNYADNLPDKALDFLQHMSRAARQMDRLTTELLDHSVSTAAEMKLQDVRLEDAIREACDSLEQQLQTCGAQLAVTGKSCLVYAEPTLLHLVLTNILSNAIKYRDPARPLEIEIAMQGRGREQWSLSISDNGIGLSEADRYKIFQPFHRVNPDIEGSGIGLSTCAEICRRHKWAFEAHGELGRGAVFTISAGAIRQPSDPEIFTAY